LNLIFEYFRNSLNRYHNTIESFHQLTHKRIVSQIFGILDNIF